MIQRFSQVGHLVSTTKEHWAVRRRTSLSNPNNPRQLIPSGILEYSPRPIQALNECFCAVKVSAGDTTFQRLSILKAGSDYGDPLKHVLISEHLLD